MKARSAALNREHDGRAWLAWHVAALGRANRLPKLETMMSKNAMKRGSSAASGTPPDRQWQIMKTIAAAIGSMDRSHGR